MDLSKALAELKEQRDHLDQAILSLERLAGGRPRRGRPRGKRLERGKKEADPAGGTGNRLKITSD